jgi:GNAT superfamily N-acetyltransferase
LRSYASIAKGTSARVSMLLFVEDRWQGRGLGLAMTCQLIDVARDKGIRLLFGAVMLENKPMLKLLRSLDLPSASIESEAPSTWR